MKRIYFVFCIVLIGFMFSNNLYSQRRNGNGNSYQVTFPKENQVSVFPLPKVMEGVNVHIADKFGPVEHGMVYYRINNSELDSIPIKGYQSIKKIILDKNDTLYLEFISSGHKPFKCKVSKATPFAVATRLEAEEGYEGEPEDPNTIHL